MEEILKEVALFSGLEPHERTLFKNLGMVRQYAEGEYLVKQGEKCDFIFVILAGAVRIESDSGSDKDAFSLLEPGDFIGEITFLIRTTPGASVIAYRDTKVLAFRHDDLKEFVFSNPGIGLRFTWSLAESLCLKIRKTTTSLMTARSMLRENDGDPD